MRIVVIIYTSQRNFPIYVFPRFRSISPVLVCLTFFQPNFDIMRDIECMGEKDISKKTRFLSKFLCMTLNAWEKMIFVTKNKNNTNQ